MTLQQSKARRIINELNDEIEKRCYEIGRIAGRSPDNVRHAATIMQRNTNATMTQTLTYMEYLSVPTRVITLRTYIDALLAEMGRFDKLYRDMMDKKE